MTEQNKNLTDGIAWPVEGYVLGEVLDSKERLVVSLSDPTAIFDAPALAEILNEYDRLVRENRELKKEIQARRDAIAITYQGNNSIND